MEVNDLLSVAVHQKKNVYELQYNLLKSQPQP